MVLKTERLILRPWEESDAEDLYKYAKDPEVGPVAGWQAHKNEAESLSVIKNVLCGKEAYAVCLKKDNRAIGAIELLLKGYNHISEKDDECELGFWLGKPFWGEGIIPEAGKELLRRAFNELGMKKVWCGHYDGNTKSARVQEKLGFKYSHTNKNVPVPLMNDIRTEHISYVTKPEWLKK